MSHELFFFRRRPAVFFSSSHSSTPSLPRPAPSSLLLRPMATHVGVPSIVAFFFAILTLCSNAQLTASVSPYTQIFPSITSTQTRTSTPTPYMTDLAPNTTAQFFYPQGGYRELLGSQLAGGLDAWVQVLLWGAGGPGTGHGAFVSGALRVSGAETLRIVVGSPNRLTDAGSGGRSAIQRANASGFFSDIVTAGGGGSRVNCYCENSADGCLDGDASASWCYKQPAASLAYGTPGSGPDSGGCSLGPGLPCVLGEMFSGPYGAGGGGGGFCGGLPRSSFCSGGGSGGGTSFTGPLVCVNVADIMTGNLSHTPFSAGFGAANPGQDGLVALFLLPSSWSPCEQIFIPVAQPDASLVFPSITASATPSKTGTQTQTPSPTPTLHDGPRAKHNENSKKNKIKK